MWSKIKDLFKSLKTKSSDGYDEKYMKIKLIQMISYLYKTLNKTIFLGLLFMKIIRIIHLYNDII